MKYLHILFLTALLTTLSLSAFSNDATQSANATEEDPNSNASIKNKTIYKFTDESGRTIFTDDPTSQQTKNAKAIESRNTNTLPAVAIPKRKAKKRNQEKPIGPIYDRLTLAEPGEEWDQQLHVEVSPELQEGHSFQVILDGTATDVISRETPIAPPEMEQGTPHTMQVSIIDEDEEVIIKSNAISLSIEQVGAMPGGFKRRVERVIRGQQMGIKTGL